MSLDELLFSATLLLARVKAFPLACDRRPVVQEVTGLRVRLLCSPAVSAAAPSLRDLREFKLVALPVSYWKNPKSLLKGCCQRSAA